MPAEDSVDARIALIKRGTVLCETEKELRQLLGEGRPLRVKLGADPSAPDIHLGHTVVLNKLRAFQRLGHEVVFIIGDFTARIGDPSGRSKTRRPLSREEVERNAQTYTEQVFRILDPHRTRVVFNSEWLSALTFEDIVKLASTTTVAQLLQRDDFSTRVKSGAPISLHEFLYPLAQAYDSVAVKADIEVGGTDQTFNLLLAREIQKAYGQRPQVILTMPILEGLDGVEKMSKSLGNYIGITDPPHEMFGKIMSISDEMMPRYYELLTELDYEALSREVGHPKMLKMRLAGEIVRLYHGEAAAEKAKRDFETAFVKRGVPSDGRWVKEFELPPGDYWLPGLMKQCGIAPSGAEARRLVRQGAVRINGEKVVDDQAKIGIRRDMKAPLIVSVGRKKFARIRSLSPKSTQE